MLCICALRGVLQRREVCSPSRVRIDGGGPGAAACIAHMRAAANQSWAPDLGGRNCLLAYAVVWRRLACVPRSNGHGGLAAGHATCDQASNAKTPASPNPMRALSRPAGAKEHERVSSSSTWNQTHNLQHNAPACITTLHRSQLSPLLAPPGTPTLCTARSQRILLEQLLHVDSARREPEQQAQHGAVPGAVHQHGRQQVAAAAVQRAQPAAECNEHRQVLE